MNKKVLLCDMLEVVKQLRIMNAQELQTKQYPKVGSSRYYSVRFLPNQKKAECVAFFAFWREIKTIAQQANETSVAAIKLAWWRDEIKRSFGGQGSHPIMQRLQPVLNANAIGSELLLTMIEGYTMDLEQTRYLDFTNLQHYCLSTAGAGTQVMQRIFGATQAQTSRFAQLLGGALQLTQVVRNVGADAKQGRIYLPVNELQRFNVKAFSLSEASYSEDFKELMRFQLRRVQGLYDQALAELPREDRFSQKPNLILANIYRALLREITRADYAVLHQRIRLTPLRKLWLAWQVQALGKWPK